MCVALVVASASDWLLQVASASLLFVLLISSLISKDNWLITSSLAPAHTHTYPMHEQERAGEGLSTDIELFTLFLIENIDQRSLTGLGGQRADNC